MFYYNYPIWWQVEWYGVGVEANLSVAMADEEVIRTLSVKHISVSG